MLPFTIAHTHPSTTTSTTSASTSTQVSFGHPIRPPLWRSTSLLFLVVRKTQPEARHQQTHQQHQQHRSLVLLLRECFRSTGAAAAVNGAPPSWGSQCWMRLGWYAVDVIVDAILLVKLKLFFLLTFVFFVGVKLIMFLLLVLICMCCRCY